MNDYITEAFSGNEDLIDERCVNKMRIIFDPDINDPLEMKYRESVCTFFSDMAMLFGNAEELKPLEFEKEYTIDYLVELIRFYKRNKSTDALAKKVYNYTDPVIEAIIDYQMIFYGDVEYGIIADILGYNLDDEDEYREFSDYIELINCAFEEGYRDVNSPEEIMYEIELNECFHEIYERTMRMNLIDPSEFVYKKERIVN